MKLTYPKNAAELMLMMDQYMWLRMVVCFLPGLVVGKLANGQEPGSFLSVTSTLLLAIGVATFLMWHKLRARLAATAEAAVAGDDDDEETHTAPVHDAPGGATLSMLAELRALCGETERESDRLVALELAIDPDKSFQQAAADALARKRMQ